MAQSNWTYSDPYGHQFNIGLYHGTKSGHVIVYCNKNILLIDFSILTTKKYSFYVGEEFLELELTKNQAKKFEYKLSVNHEIHTSLNIKRNTIARRDNMIAACLGIVFFLTVGFTCYAIFST